MARALASVLEPDDLTVVVNVGDDDEIYGLHVSPDLDTVVYTLAGIEGPHGWGRAGDTFEAMGGLEELGTNTSFRLGDRDLALCLLRTMALADGETLAGFTRFACERFGVPLRVVPVTNDPVRTKIKTRDGEWLDFQDYFVSRRHEDPVRELRFDGAAAATPAPGVIEAIASADAIVIAPSNPPLSIWPLLAVPGIAEAVSAKPVVAAVSPLFGGVALKGPAASVMKDLGLPPGNDGVLAAYDGLVTHLVVDRGDAADVARLQSGELEVHAADTRVRDPEKGTAFAAVLMSILRRALKPARAG